MQIFTKRYKQGVWDVRAVVESGGMPSSHSALTAVSPSPPPPFPVLSNLLNCHNLIIPSAYLLFCRAAVDRS